MTALSPRRAARSAKGLSLNFPILPPVTGSAAVPSPRARADTCPPSAAALPSPTKPGSDILTLVAAQERRVLELREELAKAESELGTLKKKWAVYEANKKRDEFRQARSMAVPLDEITNTSPYVGLSGEVDLEEERRRRRALVERTRGDAGHRHSLSVRSGRRTSTRVFTGSHTRTLSLLSPQSNSTPTQSLPGTPIEQASAGSAAEEAVAIPALDGFVQRPQSFGKTYKDLAAQRKPMSPSPADTFVKSGKLVVEGVRDGLWTFIEDLRLATVGDEAINGTAAGIQRRRSSKPKPRSSQESAGDDGRTRLKQEPSFWSEFGVDSPARTTGAGAGAGAGGERRQRAPQEKRHRSKEATASTSSQNVPDLLDDTTDEEWEQWDSPVNSDKHEGVTVTSTTKAHTTDQPTNVNLGDLPVPWPLELDKATTPKGLNIENAI